MGGCVYVCVCVCLCALKWKYISPHSYLRSKFGWMVTRLPIVEVAGWAQGPV